MSQYPPPPPGYPQPQQQQFAPQPGYPQQQPQPGYPQQQPAQPGGWVDNSQYIGGWHAAQFGMQTGKYIEYKVTSRPTAKGGTYKQVTFFRPYEKKNKTWGEGTGFSFNQMKELVEKINHFINNFCDEKGFFVWQPSVQMQGAGNAAAYPPPQQQQFAPPPYQQPAAPRGYPQGMPYATPPPPPQPVYQQPAAPQYPQPAADPYGAPQQLPPPPAPGGVTWP